MPEVQQALLVQKPISWLMGDHVFLDQKQKPINQEIFRQNLSLGQGYLGQALAEKSSDFSQAEDHLNQALEGLRQGGEESFVVLSLLARTGLYRVQKNWRLAHRDLQEAISRAKRSGMALHQADAHLEYARLYLAQGDKEKAQENLTIAKQMIADIGYYRRRQDVLSLEDQLRRIR